MRDRLAAIKLVQALLHGGEEFDALHDFTKGSFIGQILDGFEDELLLRHGKNMEGRSLGSKGRSRRTGKRRSMVGSPKGEVALVRPLNLCLLCCLLFKSGWDFLQKETKGTKGLGTDDGRRASEPLFTLLPSV